jgi:SAM-dependent methyltransferase
MSRERLESHRAIWDGKPALGAVYAVWFDWLLGTVAPGGRVLEVGAGPGFLSAYARARRPDLRWVASDVTAVPWNDLVADGLALPFPAGAFDAILALDLVHHLARPGAFFVEAARVLRPCGHVAVVEPWVTPLSFPIYRWLHEEGCTPGLDPWNPFGVSSAPKDAFAGDAAVVWRLVRDTPEARWREMGLDPPRATVLNCFAYLLSLGFRPGSLLPRSLVPFLLRADRRTGALAPWLGLRVQVLWTRARDGA